MDYAVGKTGRVIVARGYEGEHVYEQIQSIVAKENVRNGVFWLVGGFRSGKVVVGPKKNTGPIEPDFTEFEGPREVAGVGTVFWDDEGPKLHMHTAIGCRSETLVGCPRGGATVFCVLEIVILEIDGIHAEREFDPELGLKLLTLRKQ